MYQDIKRGIPRGSSLSALLGAFYLMELDQKMEKLDVKYFRYMDDIQILSPTRWKLRKAIGLLNQTLSELKLEKHPDKTLIGKVERGFDFLGYFLKPYSLDVSEKTVGRFVERIVRLYEQESPNRRERRLGQYVLRWIRWVRSGLWEVWDKKSRTKPKPCFFRVLGDVDLFLKLSPESCKTD